MPSSPVGTSEKQESHPVGWLFVFLMFSPDSNRWVQSPWGSQAIRIDFLSYHPDLRSSTLEEIRNDRNPSVPEEAWPAPGPRDRQGDARAPGNGEAAPHGLGRKPPGDRVQDDPVRERPASRSMAGPRFGFHPA